MRASAACVHCTRLLSELHNCVMMTVDLYADVMDDDREMYAAAAGTRPGTVLGGDRMPGH